MKDNLIDEEKAKQEEAAQETFEQKIDRLGTLKFEHFFWNFLFEISWKMFVYERSVK